MAKGESMSSTRQERSDLVFTIKQRAKVSAADIDHRAAQILAEVEKQLCAYYPMNNPAWEKVTSEAEAAVKRADDFVAKRCAELGIKPEFRPSMHITWYGRGATAVKERRDELRQAAKEQVEALVKEAKLEVLRQSTAAVEAITVRGLASDEAKELFAQLPTAEKLLPGLKLQDLERALPLRRHRQPWMDD